ncbi:hypothetical protein [Paludisphaera sp.]|uniref:hypothetical protein n=1 Tax=Paludisphaera sp. TaxID=2017432 RepID=UPI00301E0645
MLTELLGKGGDLCSHARSGDVRCPLIVRPTSEDVVTGHVFQALGCLNPRWWLPDLLNTALGADRFRRRVFRDLEIRLWQNQPRYPRGLLPWEEGPTQVDAVITWENPATTVFVEAKYGSGLSANVSGDDGSSGFPSDQLIRNIRVGLHHAGYLRTGRRLFEQRPRDLVVLVLAPTTGHPLVGRYRDTARLLSAIPHSDRLDGLPRGPFVGELGYDDVNAILRRQSRFMTSAERRVVRDLTSYLEFKAGNPPSRSTRIATPTGPGSPPETRELPGISGGGCLD